MGIFHTLVSSLHMGVVEKSLHRMDFLWVQWFGVEPSQYQYGIRHAWLPKIGFIESADPYTFTFLNPVQVIKGVHIILVYLEEHTSGLLPSAKSIACILNPKDEDD